MMSKRGYSHLIDGVEDVVVEVVLRVDGDGLVGAFVVFLEEELLEGHGVLLLEVHHHLVAQAKQHQLGRERERERERERI